MRAKLTGTTAITTDLDAEATWSPAGFRGQYGTARVTVDRDSAAWTTDVIDELGGMLIELRHGNLPPWRGIADRPRFTPAGIELDCIHVEEWVKIRHIPHPLTVYGATPGHIVSAAFRMALAGTHLPVRRGAICLAPPHVDEYEISGTFEDILTDMTEWSGMVWEIDRHWRFNWQADLGQFHEQWLTDDGVLFSELQLGELADQYGEVIEVHGGGQTQRVNAEDVPLMWPSQTTERI